MIEYFIPFGVGVRSGNHLWEVVHRDVIVAVQHQVELIEVTMNETVVRQLHYQLHTLVIQSRCVTNFLNLGPKIVHNPNFH